MGPAVRRDDKDEDKYLAANAYGNETSRKKKGVKHARKSNMPKHAERSGNTKGENVAVSNNNMLERPETMPEQDMRKQASRTNEAKQATCQKIRHARATIRHAGT